jgi:hypothetical protein
MIGNGWGKTYYQGRIEPSPPPASKIFKKFEGISTCRGSRSCARRVGGREGGWLSLEIDEAGSHEPTKEIS